MAGFVVGLVAGSLGRGKPVIQRVGGFARSTYERTFSQSAHTRARTRLHERTRVDMHAYMHV